MTAPRTPRLQDVVELAVDRAMGELHVALPGNVTAYDATTQKADVAPITRQTYVDADGAEQSVKLPVIRNVPVLFPAGGGFRLTFPLASGDHVWLVFSDSSLDKYLQNGGSDVDPVSLHTHHLTDAVAVPGLHSFSKPWSGASSSAVTLGKDGGPQVVCQAAQIHLGADAVVPAVDAVIKGTTYRAGEATMNALLSAHLTSVAAAHTAAAAAWSALAAFPLLLPLAATSGAAAGGHTAAAATATAAAAGVSSFEGAAAAYLSTVVKTS